MDHESIVLPICRAPERVAKITIPSQDLMSSYLDRFRENLSFNPWHLEEHKQMGRVGRRVYLAISERHHQLNRVVMQAPVPDKALESGLVIAHNCERLGGWSSIEDAVIRSDATC